MESAIIRAIKDHMRLKQIGCWRHLRQDVQCLLKDNLPTLDRSSYVFDLYEILRAQTKQHCTQLIEGMKAKWHDDFVRYVMRTTEPKLSYFCVWAIQGYCKFKFDPYNGITTNQSEGFNFLIKQHPKLEGSPARLSAHVLKINLRFLLGGYETRKSRFGDVQHEEAFLKVRNRTA